MDESITRSIEEFAAAAQKLRAAVSGLTHHQLHAFPVPGTWSIQQIVVHLADSDGIGVDRMKRIAAEDNPLLIGYNETRYVQRLFYEDQSTEDALTLFEVTRRQFVRVLRKLPADSFARTGIHNEVGKVSLATQLKKYNEHFEHHLTFIEKKRKLV